jgi:hypothetical protein
MGQEIERGTQKRIMDSGPETEIPGTIRARSESKKQTQ